MAPKIKRLYVLEEWNIGIKNLSKTRLPSANVSGGKIVV